LKRIFRFLSYICLFVCLIFKCTHEINRDSFSQNFATADRPRCLLRDEFYIYPPHSHQQQQQQQQLYSQHPQQRRYRKFNYYSRDDDFQDNDQNWRWNMKYQQQQSNNSSNCNGSSSVNSRPLHQNHYNQNYHQSKSRSTSDRSSASSSSGFQSFFRWFKRDDKSSRQRNSKDIRYPRDLTSSTDTLEFDNERNIPPVQYRRKFRAYNSTDINTPPPSPTRLSYVQSSSCDSVFSTASSFAFVPPIKYLLNRNQKQVSINVGQ
jgi:hypothetical protein